MVELALAVNELTEGGWREWSRVIGLWLTFDLLTLHPTESMGVYDDIDADVLRNYQEFALVNLIYYGMKESTTSEQSARMTAMDSASKNACKTAPSSP
jgi:hypothetical protein